MLALTEEQYRRMTGNSLEAYSVEAHSLEAVELQKLAGNDDGDADATLVWVPPAQRKKKRKVVLAIGAGLFLAGCATGVQVLEHRPAVATSTGSEAEQADAPIRAAAMGFVPETHARSPEFEGVGAAPLPPLSKLVDGCPSGMANVEGRFCIDKYEASLVEIMRNGAERNYSPFEMVGKHRVRAVSRGGVTPQGYISGEQAAAACHESGKRLCKPKEWKLACMGPKKKKYGYGEKVEPRRCNDHGKSPMAVKHAQLGSHTNLWADGTMNSPDLNQIPGTLAKTGAHDGCTNDYGVYDMVGNLHEWVDDHGGTFQGGYYQDTHLNGDGCNYATVAHDYVYHDYSTGFRCCADPEL